MFGLGIGELLIILVIVVVLFSRRFPDLGESDGAAITKLRRAVNEPDELDMPPRPNSGKNGPKQYPVYASPSAPATSEPRSFVPFVHLKNTMVHGIDSPGRLPKVFRG